MQKKRDKLMNYLFFMTTKLSKIKGKCTALFCTVHTDRIKTLYHDIMNAMNNQVQWIGIKLKQRKAETVNRISILFSFIF